MMVDMPAEIKEMFNDYHINLIQAGDQKTYNFNNDDVKALFVLYTASTIKILSIWHKNMPTNHYLLTLL